MKFNYLLLKRLVLTCASTAVFFLSCEKEKKEAKLPYRNGVFIVNEGAFNGNNGSISFYSNEQQGMYYDIYNVANNRVLGDVVQSMTTHNGSAYIVVNNSNKVEVVDTPYFRSNGVIEEVISPRYMVAKGNYGYLSCWGDNSVKVINLAANSVSSSITVSSGPEKMCIVHNKLYVANTGAWSTDSVISVIDLESHEVIKQIEVKYTPSDMVVDSDSNLWVLCYGQVVYGTEEPYPILKESPSKIFSIDTETDEVLTETILFDSQHPAQLEINSEGIMYFGGGYTFEGIYRFIPDNRSFSLVVMDFAYGLNIDPVTDEIYVTLSPSITMAGSCRKYAPDWEILADFDCGIGPNSVVFANPQ